MSNDLINTYKNSQVEGEKHGIEQVLSLLLLLDSIRLT